MVKLRGVVKWFGGKRVLAGVSLDVREGERVVLLGENGSGKSTLLGIVAGVIEPDGGEVDVRASIGFAPERPDLPSHLLVAEWFDLVAALKRASWEGSIPTDVERLLGLRIGALSLGQRQRVSLAAAFLGAPSLLLFDEPTNALDVDARAAFFDRLASGTAVVATHDRDLAQKIATRTMKIRGGEIVEARTE